jgi:hypothetical protein
MLHSIKIDFIYFLYSKMKNVGSVINMYIVGNVSNGMDNHEVRNAAINNSVYWGTSLNQLPTSRDESLNKVICESKIYTGFDLPEYTTTTYDIRDDLVEPIKLEDNNLMEGSSGINFIISRWNLQTGLILGIKVIGNITSLRLVENFEIIATPQMDDYGIYRFITPIPNVCGYLYLFGTYKGDKPKISMIIGICDLPNPFTGLIETSINGSVKYIKYSCYQVDGDYYQQTRLISKN